MEQKATLQEVFDQTQSVGLWIVELPTGESEYHFRYDVVRVKGLSRKQILPNKKIKKIRRISAIGNSPESALSKLLGPYGN